MAALPASTGWQWFKDGVALFRQQPGILTMLLFTNLLVTLLISIFPVIGPVAATVLVPSFIMAVMQACHLIEQGERVTPAVLLTGFHQPAFARLCKLGLVYVGMWLVLTLLSRLLIDDDFWQKVTGPVDAQTGRIQVDAGDMLAMMGISALQCVSMLALCFSAPLSYWKQMTPGKATFYSVFGVLGAWRPILVMLLSGFGIFMLICMVATLILGNANAGRVVIIWIMLLFVLLLQCAIYAAYRQIFGAPEAVSLDKPDAP